MRRAKRFVQSATYVIIIKGRKNNAEGVSWHGWVVPWTLQTNLISKVRGARVCISGNSPKGCIIREFSLIKN
jgi:hypothetical protein